MLFPIGKDVRGRSDPRSAPAAGFSATQGAGIVLCEEPKEPGADINRGRLVPPFTPQRRPALLPRALEVAGGGRGIDLLWLPAPPPYFKFGSGGAGLLGSIIYVPPAVLPGFPSSRSLDAPALILLSDDRELDIRSAR
ncbi:hypothetical protein CALVIDRAFT_567169 [Calocera viscosa TUFC12733]|uniref:Uncharacterized protein n=1 Tax=Calocera viscosa (strain TUFC12733) TaxID=1330018 RepID=A0A167IIM4_CALVF|nr:hypothetical protein CALVIDRAFT_567169 [Calocera viscosa TUFC12733]